MSASVRSYIMNHLRNETAVGIVSFESDARELAPMTVITSPAVRNDLESKVPNRTYGLTAIGEGLQTCQTVRNIADKQVTVLFYGTKLQVFL